MPRTLSVEEYKELGKRYYGRKDYERARDAFSDGIDASTGRDIQLYDYRSATYDKLGDASAALADARHMIKAFEKDPKGYLRAGQLLIKMDKKPQALQIYARGLKYVPPMNHQINLLRGAHDKLNRELCPPTAIDPFTQLPHELVSMIMSYLKLTERVSCLRVSKQWKQYLEDLPELWTRMDLLKAGGRRSVSKEFVKRCVRMAKGGITYARIANFGHKGVLAHLVRECKHLEKLEFVITPFGETSILESVVPARALKSLVVHGDIEIHGNAITQILKHRPTLEELRIHYVGSGCSIGKSVDFALPNLRIVELKKVPSSFLILQHLKGLLENATSIVDFTFEELVANYFTRHGTIFALFANLTQLQHLHMLSQTMLGFPVANPATLRTLHFETKQPVPIEPISYPKLERLSIKTPFQANLLASLLGDSDIGNNAEPTSHLMSLSYSADHELSLDELGHILDHPRLKDLEELELQGPIGSYIGDADVSKFVALRCLRRLHLNSASITGLGIKELVTTLKGSLKHITLTACDDVGHDALDWAAKQGIEVVVLSHVNGMRLVRR